MSDDKASNVLFQISGSDSSEITVISSREVSACSGKNGDKILRAVHVWRKVDSNNPPIVTTVNKEVNICKF